MSKMAEKTKKAKFRHADVSVLLDETLADREAELLTELQELKTKGSKDDRLGRKNAAAVTEKQKELDALYESAPGSVLTLRIRSLPHARWQYLVSKSPARTGVVEDSRVGYDWEHLTRLFLEKEGQEVEDGEVVAVDPDAVPDFLAAINSNNFHRIYGVIFGLNEKSVQIEAAKKA